MIDGPETVQLTLIMLFNRKSTIIEWISNLSCHVKNEHAYSRTTECPTFDFLKIEDHDTTHIHVSCGKGVSVEKNKYIFNNIF